MNCSAPECTKTTESSRFVKGMCINHYNVSYKQQRRAGRVATRTVLTPLQRQEIAAYRLSYAWHTISSHYNISPDTVYMYSEYPDIDLDELEPLPNPTLTGHYLEVEVKHFASFGMAPVDVAERLGVKLFDVERVMGINYHDREGAK